MTEPIHGATTRGAYRFWYHLCAIACIAMVPNSATAEPASNTALPVVLHPLTEPTSSHGTATTKSGRPVRMKGRIQFDDDAAKGTKGIDAAVAASKPGELDYDLYMRHADDSIPRNLDRGSPWQTWTERLLTDVHTLIEHDLSVPGYADLILTVKQDGHCTAEFGTLMGGPIFKRQTLALVRDLDTQQTLHFPPTPGLNSISLKLGAGAFHPNETEGHFWCGVGDEIPTAAAQLKNRYSKCNE